MKTVVLDTDDPPGMAEFYTALLGWRVTWADEEWVTIRGGGEVAIAFQLVLNYRAPSWPDDAVPQQFHIDFGVRDLPGAVAHAESVGAGRFGIRSRRTASGCSSTRAGIRSASP